MRLNNKIEIMDSGHFQVDSVNTETLRVDFFSVLVLKYTFEFKKKSCSCLPKDTCQLATVMQLINETEII